MSNDLIRELGPLAFASRLRRLSERLMQDVSSLYADHGSDFEPRWFPVAYLLRQRTTMSITEISGSIGYSHPAVVQIAAAMERRGLVKSRSDAGDGRRRLLSLTARGKSTLEKITPIWDAVRASTQDIISGSGHDVLGVLDALERELDKQGLLPRVRRGLRAHTAPIEIIPFTRALAPHFARLNREWLGHDVPIEPHDQEVIDNPSREVVSKGGQIMFARVGRDILGTVAIVPHGAGRFEIAKMAVTSKCRGEGIGRQLTVSAIGWANDQNASVVLIATSPKLARALSLYRSLGFRNVAPDHAWKRRYKRRTVFMELSNPRISSSTNKE